MPERTARRATNAWNFRRRAHRFFGGGRAVPRQRRQEGSMTKRRIAIVSKRPLEEAVRAMGIGYVYFSGGENNLGKRAFPACSRRWRRAFIWTAAWKARAPLCVKNCCRMQEILTILKAGSTNCTRTRCCTRSVRARGQDHAPWFTVRVTASGKSAQGSGASKEQAEQSAAKALLEMLGATRGE